MKTGIVNDIAPVYRDGETCPYFVMANDSADGVSLPDVNQWKNLVMYLFDC